MDLRVIEKDETSISIEIAGEDHTFMNVLKGALLETDGVAAATYDMNPEQSGGQTDPVLTIKTEEDTDALDALEAGTDRVIEKASALTALKREDLIEVNTEDGRTVLVPDDSVITAEQPEEEESFIDSLKRQFPF